jgi:N-acetylneuraminic acid mutarotase
MKVLLLFASLLCMANSTYVPPLKPFISHTSVTEPVPSSDGVFGDRIFNVLFEIGSELWSFGGTTPDYNHHNDMYRLNPLTHTWELKATNNPPPVREQPASIVYNNELYILGGSSNILGEDYSDLWKFNPVLLTWFKLHDMILRVTHPILETLLGGQWSAASVHGLLEAPKYGNFQEVL